MCPRHPRPCITRVAFHAVCCHAALLTHTPTHTATERSHHQPPARSGRLSCPPPHTHIHARPQPCPTQPHRTPPYPTIPPHLMIRSPPQPVIIIGNVVSFVSILWFGASTTYATAMAARAFGGFFNGILGAWKCMISESTDVSMQVRLAYGYHRDWVDITYLHASRWRVLGNLQGS